MIKNIKLKKYIKLKYIIILIIIIFFISISPFFVSDYLKIKKGESMPLVSVGEFLENPVYDKTVKIYGEVSYLKEANQFRRIPDCPCFSLYSDGKVINIWYDDMELIGPINSFSVDITEIKNGQNAIIIGELKSESKDLPFKEFWAKKVEKLK